jgi:hypothetical protein
MMGGRRNWLPQTGHLAEAARLSLPAAAWEHLPPRSPTGPNRVFSTVRSARQWLIVVTVPKN